MQQIGFRVIHAQVMARRHNWSFEHAWNVIGRLETEFRIGFWQENPYDVYGYHEILDARRADRLYVAASPVDQR